MARESIWDLAVVGAGPAGAVATWTATRLGLRVAMFDAGPRALPGVGESLPAAAAPMLRSLGLEGAVLGHRPCYGNTFSWGTADLQTMDALRDPHGHGWHLDRLRFDGFLRSQAISITDRHVERPVTDVVEDADGVCVVAGPKTYRARMVIDATGRRAAVARRLGAKRSRDDSLVALCAWAEMPHHDPDGRTVLEACPAGWWYTAALPNGTRSVVLHTDANVARRLSEPHRWHALLGYTNYVRHLVEGGVFGRRPRGAEACGAQLDRFCGDRWLPVGDAGCSFDPVSSQGIFTALYTGLRGAEAAAAAIAGDTAALWRYAERIQSIRDAYLARHRHAYAAETRWSTTPFWQARRAVQRASAATIDGSPAPKLRETGPAGPPTMVGGPTAALPAGSWDYPTSA